MSMAATTTQTPHESVSAFVNVRPQLEREYEQLAVNLTTSLLTRTSVINRNADFQNTESTKTEYRNSFDTLARTVGPYKLWNVVNEVSNTFNKDLHPRLRGYLNDKRRSIRPPRHYRGPKEPGNALRCYMVGLTQDRASPHVAILCKEGWFRTQARHIILESGFLQDRGWMGCIRLPGEISQKGVTSPSPKSTVEMREHPSSRQNEHNVAISYIPGSTKTPCGLRIAISGIDGYVRMATLGGTIELNEALFGLSVSHAFSTLPQIYDETNSECPSDNETFVLDPNDLDPFVRTAASDELLDDMKQTPDTSEASDPSAKNTEAIEAEDISTSPGVDNDTVDPSISQQVDSEMTKWSLGSREIFGNEAAYEFEWALISSFILYDRLANATTANSGRLLSITSVASEKAPAGTRLLLTTPRGGIAVIAVSSESSVQLTPGKKYLSLWTVRLDRVEDGDCGSWVIDEATGELFGMLVANCEALCEAYILPIKDIFMDIEKLSGHSVKLPASVHKRGIHKASSDPEVEAFARERGPLVTTSLSSSSSEVSESDEPQSPALSPRRRRRRLESKAASLEVTVEDATATSLKGSHPMYSPLEPNSLRIVNLLPGKREASVQCEFSVRSFDHQVDYESLSYVPGRPQHRSSTHVDGQPEPTSSPIYVDGRMIEVNSNLASALKNLRYSNISRPLWVDALSINQEDVEEKNHQVSHMASILTRASNVCIWLGEGSEEYRWAFSRYESIIDLLNFAYIGEVDLAMRLASAFASLAGREWFQLGIVQDVCLASSSTIHCGRDSMPWKDFADAITLFTTYRHPNANRHHSSTKSRRMNERDTEEDLSALSAFVRCVDGSVQRLDDGQIKRKYSLKSLVMESPLIEPLIYHDFIYSKLSLASDITPSSKPLITSTANASIDVSPSLHVFNQKDITASVLKAAEAFLRPLERRSLIVDYSQPFEHVCQDFVNLVIQNSQSLDILCRPWAPKTDRLPSWVPDWTKGATLMNGKEAIRRLNGITFTTQDGHTTYDASRLKHPKFRMSDRSVSALSISVEGFTLDVVQEKHNPALMGNVPPGWVDLLGWDDIKGPPPDRVWRTLVADRGLYFDEPPPRFYSRACELVFRQNEPNYDVDIKFEIQRGDPITRDFCRRVEKVIWGRRLVKTKKHNFVGLAPGTTKKRDIIAILYGLSVPVVLRQVQDAAEGDNVFTIVGECFIYGMMDGEALGFRKAQRIQEQTFVLR